MEMNTEPELLNERLERLAMVLDEIMPKCAALVRDALELLKKQEAVEPIHDDDGYYRCRSCNAYVAFPKGIVRRASARCAGRL